MNVDPSILVTLPNPLEADGLVSRERDPADRRRHLVTLTLAGERTLVSASRAQKETEDALFASLDDEQREQLGALLIALRDGLAADTEARQRAAEPEPVRSRRPPWTCPVTRKEPPAVRLARR